MRAFYLLCCAALTSLTSAQIRQYFIREPDNQTAIEGEQVSGSCGDDDDSDGGGWLGLNST